MDRSTQTIEVGWCILDTQIVEVGLYMQRVEVDRSILKIGEVDRSILKFGEVDRSILKIGEVG